MMSRNLTMALLLIVAGSVSFAQTVDPLFDQGNQAYRQGKFPDAIQKYEKILQLGNVSGELLYNLGNAYYKTGNIGKAILNYERALRRMPTDDDLRHNLQLANLMIIDKIEATPRLFVWDWWDSVKSAFSLSTITWICYTLFVLVVAAAALAVLAPSYAKRKMAFFGGLGTSLLLIFAIVIFVGRLREVNDTTAAVVIANITTAKNSPDPRSTDAFVLHAGVKVSVTDRVNDWMKIRLADGKVGWMEQKAAETI